MIKAPPWVECARQQRLAGIRSSLLTLELQEMPAHKHRYVLDPAGTSLDCIGCSRSLAVDPRPPEEPTAGRAKMKAGSIKAASNPANHPLPKPKCGGYHHDRGTKGAD